MTLTEQAWTAGFMDGEGNFGIYPEKGHRHRPVIQLTNTSLESILVTQKRLFGYGSVIRIKRKMRPNHKVQYRLMIRNALEIVRVVYSLLPHLVTKHAAAEQLLAFCISRSARKGNGRYAPFTDSENRMVKRLYALNKKGV